MNSKVSYQNFSRNRVAVASDVINSMLPPLCFIIWREMLRPMPLPVGLVVKKGTKICWASSEGMGLPLLLMSMKMESSGVV